MFPCYTGIALKKQTNKKKTTAQPVIKARQKNSSAIFA